MEISLLHTFEAAQQGEENEILFIIEKFNPLLSKYAGRLSAEDGKNELIFFLLAFIKKADLTKFQFDAQLIAYLEQSVVHEYIRLSKKYDKTNQHEQLLGDENINAEVQDFALASDSNLFVSSCFQKLNDKEQRVLYLHYVLEYSIAEIAELCQVSRQAVNQLKNRAVKKISSEF